MDSEPQLPPRPGPRPRTTSELPHSQLDQQPSDDRQADAILAEAQTWPFVEVKASEISVEGARALTLESTAGSAGAFMTGREFCHVHDQGDFSLHAVLPLALAKAAETAGWAEPHYLVHTGKAPGNLVMLYAPRDDRERAVVLRLVRASYDFVRSQTGEPATGTRESRLVPTSTDAKE